MSIELLMLYNLPTNTYHIASGDNPELYEEEKALTYTYIIIYVYTYLGSL